MTTTIEGLEGLQSAVGSFLGHSDWVTITQHQVNTFAEATGDHQWIHVDPERAKHGPFGGPVAHGYLTLSLAPVLLGSVLQVQGVSMGVNYGLNKLRFPAPVPVGSQLRLGATLSAVEEITGGSQVVIDLIFEVEGQAKPACVASAVYRYYS